MQNGLNTEPVNPFPSPIQDYGEDQIRSRIQKHCTNSKLLSMQAQNTNVDSPSHPSVPI